MRTRRALTGRAAVQTSPERAPRTTRGPAAKTGRTGTRTGKIETEARTKIGTGRRRKRTRSENAGGYVKLKLLLKIGIRICDSFKNNLAIKFCSVFYGLSFLFNETIALEEKMHNIYNKVKIFTYLP